MTKKRKWEIQELTSRDNLTEAAGKVISHRIKILVTSIKKFFNDETPENLHEVRIALRRLRYNMEVFFSCFEKKKFLIFYKTVTQLQDLTGTKRDFDVLLENLNSISSSEQINVDQSIIKAVDEKNSQLKETLLLELKKFIHSKEFKDFKKIVL